MDTILMIGKVILFMFLFGNAIASLCFSVLAINLIREKRSPYDYPLWWDICMFLFTATMSLGSSWAAWRFLEKLI